MFVWDKIKEDANIKKHGIAFAAAYDFENDSVIMFNRTRMADEEERFAAVGFIYGKLHTMIYTPRSADIRVISLRRSNRREEKDYEKTIKKED
ncbi:MAG: BrnT family toxin [Alphaproteobacteria bacterium]|nr:BrnT family toxin [Alphaproteobacteria bacterium]